MSFPTVAMRATIGWVREAMIGNCEVVQDSDILEYLKRCQVADVKGVRFAAESSVPYGTAIMFGVLILLGEPGTAEKAKRVPRRHSFPKSWP